MFLIVTRSGQVIDDYLTYNDAATAAQEYYLVHGIGAFVVYDDTF